MTTIPSDQTMENLRSTRSVVFARNGLIATSQPLASAAGLQVLMAGGNAVDAAVTAAATLSVVEPTMTGIGGDLFALLHEGRTGAIHALNASGRAPRAASLEAVLEVGEMPSFGIESVSVPGAVDGWHQLLERHGTISFGRALAPAIEYARNGFAVTEVVASQWQTTADLLALDPAAANTFLPNGRAPRAGEVFANPYLAETLQQLAREGRDAFYEGPIAKAIAADARRRNGWLDEADLTAHRSDWVEPIRTTFRGYEVLELPPNTQGITALEALNLLELDDLGSLQHNSAAYLHRLIEAIRIAFADRDAYIADPASVPPELIERLVSKEYAVTRHNEIDPDQAAPTYAPWGEDVAGNTPGAPRSGKGDTVYLATADRQGNVVSLIQSLFGAFGSGIVAGDTGIVLQNRASLFSTDPTHPNCLAPGKRPFHTLVPALVLRADAPWLSFGVMGGDMQTQAHVQVLLNMLLFGMNVQAAGEAARARWTGDGVALETGISEEARRGLRARGHRLVEMTGGFGGYQGIQVDAARGVLMGGSDPRKDGLAMGY